MYQVAEDDFNSEPFKSKWNELLRYRNLDIGQQHEYCKLWWNYYKNSIIKKDLLLIVESNDHFNNIWPMMIRKQYFQKGLFVIGHIDGFITDYCFPIVQTSTFFKGLNTFICFLENNKIRWNYVKLNIPEWTEYIDAKFLNKNISKYYKVKIYDYYSAILLNNSFEDYVSNLGTKTRSDIRRYLRIYKQEKFKFIVYSGKELKDNIKNLIKLNLLNWNVFISDETQLFIEELSRINFSSTSGKIILPTLYYENTVIASVFGFVNNESCFLHAAGVQRREIKSLAPGITLYALLIQYLIENKISNLDLSPGVEEYKLRLGAKKKSIRQIVVFKNWHSKFIYNIGLFMKNSLTRH